MRRVWTVFGLPLAILFGAVGCANQDAYLRPPKQPESFAPPPDDAKYSQPIAYPKNLLFQDGIHARDLDAPAGSGPMRGAGAGSPGGR